MDGAADRDDLASRWCALAEQRLEYLTRLFETERWRRYYSELTFLQNIREAKAAVETWRSLSAGGAIASAGPNNVQTSAPPVAREPVPEIDVAIHPATTTTDQASSAPEADLPALQRAAEEVEDQVLDLAAIERRYPLLRNAL